MCHRSQNWTVEVPHHSSQHQGRMVPVAEASHLALQWRTMRHPGSIRGISQVSFLPATSLTRARGVLLPCVPWRPCCWDAPIDRTPSTAILEDFSSLSLGAATSPWRPWSDLDSWPSGIPTGPIVFSPDSLGITPSVRFGCFSTVGLDGSASSNPAELLPRPFPITLISIEGGNPKPEVACWIGTPFYHSQSQ